MIARARWHLTRRLLWPLLPGLAPAPALPTQHPDGELRHLRLAAAILCEHSSGTVLNAGDPLMQLGRHLPGFQVTSTDLGEPLAPIPPGTTFIRADFTKAEQHFADASFDLVVSTDVLEHIPARDRRAFIAHAVRIARRGAYLAFPAGEPARRAEELIRRSRSRHNYRSALDEHAEHGLPDPAEVLELCAELGVEASLTPLSTIPEWLTSFVFDAGDREDPALIADYFTMLNRSWSSEPGPGAPYRYLLQIRR